MKAFITADLLFGDAGKGTVVDYLSAKYRSTLVVRYNGGSQCAHNVYANGNHFCFHQLSSGSFNNADTLLLDSVIINPILLGKELTHFKNQFGSKYQFEVFIHTDALVTTPYHVTANRVEELVLGHGSCGLGIWKTAEYAEKFPEDAIRIKDLYSSFSKLCDKLKKLRDRFKSIVDESIDSSYKQNYMSDELLINIAKSLQKSLDDTTFRLVGKDAGTYLRMHETVIFEGAQGVLLDKDRGFLPHVSATDTTTSLAEAYLKRIGYEGDIHKIGIIRSYVTRHGTGPLPTEVHDVDLKPIRLFGENNEYNEWQKNFRVGTFDKELIQKALEICPVDFLFVTCLDNDPFNKNPNFEQKARSIANIVNVPLMGFSFGKDREQKRSVIDFQ